MPSIKYKKKTYAGATFPVLEMTKAEYDALPEAKKMDGTVYMITDDTGGWEAENSAYDNTQSGLTATNVQDALDEVSSAGGVSYDNTTSGLTATNVQNALNEVVGKFGKDKKFGILLFSNLATLTVPLEAVQDSGHHAAVIVIGPNQNSFATISTGAAVRVNNFGTATVAATMDGTNLKITKSTSGTFWGMTFVIVACAYPLSWA